MKNYIALTFALLFYGASIAQIGINTTSPSSTLDVNGTLRVRNLPVSIIDPAVQIVGADQYGNMTPFESGRNIQFNDNVIESDNAYTIDRSMDIFIEDTIHDFIVFPEGPTSGSNLIRIRTTFPISFLTGLEAAPDGTVMMLYPTDGILTLLPLNGGSLPQNQIMPNANLVIPQYQTVQLFYDADIQKWIVI